MIRLLPARGVLPDAAQGFFMLKILKSAVSADAKVGYSAAYIPS